MPKEETGGTGGRRRRGPYAGFEQKRAAIVDSAFRVFAEHGYQAGSLQRIADQIGMSQTNLLHYFPRKSDLLLAVLGQRDRLGSVDIPPPDRAAEFPDAVLDQARENEDIPGLIALYSVLAGEAVTQDNPAREFFQDRMARMRDQYTHALEAMRDMGMLREGVDPRSAATQLIALWDGLQSQWLLDPDAIDVPGQLRDHLSRIVTDDAWS